MSLIIRQKKGALQLSINAIVVLILAITMLGLGLSFMRNMFGSTTAQFAEISSELKTQMIEQIKASGDKVILNKYEIEMKKAEMKTYYFGIKNVEADPILFDISISCNDAINPDIEPSDIEATHVEFSTFDEREVMGGDVEVIPFNVKTLSSADLTTFSCSIEIENGDEIYGIKNFYVTIK